MGGGMPEVDAAKMSKYLRGDFAKAIEQISSEIHSRGGTVSSSVSDTSGYVRATDGCRCLEWRMQLLNCVPCIDVVYEGGVGEPRRARIEPLDPERMPPEVILWNFLWMC